MRLIYCLLIITVLLLAECCYAEDSPEDCLRYYQEGDFTRAREVASVHLNQPEARWVYYLCLLHDPERQDIAGGLKGLLDLRTDESADIAIRLQAGLSYARMVQLLQARKNRPEYDSVDVEKVYQEILSQAGYQPIACTAVQFLAEKYFDSPSSDSQDKGFHLLETFIDEYSGKEKDLIYLHLYLDRYYVDIRKDYRSSYEHLKKAYALGIAVDRYRRECLFALGRISDIQLHDYSTARGWYDEYMRLFPRSSEAVLIKRYLKELESKLRE